MHRDLKPQNILVGADKVRSSISRYELAVLLKINLSWVVHVAFGAKHGSVQ